jgi:hypothetical protein
MSMHPLGTSGLRKRTRADELLEQRSLQARGEFLDPEKNSPLMIPRCYEFRNGDAN